MTQTWAIFYDAYRSLNAKKMFWVVLAISGLVVAIFGLVGINEGGVKIAFWQWDTDWITSESVPQALYYRTMFLVLGVNIWLTWIATILALISTAGIFPDLFSSGSIDLLVSKPIGRLRLFLTQYTAGLLFVALQVGIFSLASFLILGLRGGVWEPGVFMAVPLVVCFFSYLYSVCVFLGVVTRSTLAALLLTLLFWFLIWIVGMAEGTLLMFRTMNEQGVTWTEMQGRPERAKPTKTSRDEPPRSAEAVPSRHLPVNSSDAQAAKDASGRKDAAKVPRAMARSLLKAVAEEPRTAGKEPTSTSADDEKGGSGIIEFSHDLVYGIKTVLPKTGDTIDLLERTLIDMADLPDKDFEERKERSKQQKVGEQMAETIRSRSVWWVVGTSLLFEAFVLAWAAWIFCRRDF